MIDADFANRFTTVMKVGKGAVRASSESPAEQQAADKAKKAAAQSAVLLLDERYRVEE